MHGDLWLRERGIGEQGERVRHQRALRERPREGVGRGRLMHRRQAHEVRTDRAHVVAAARLARAGGVIERARAADRLVEKPAHVRRTRVRKDARRGNRGRS